MNPIADVAFSAREIGGCLRGTRKDVLFQIEQWLLYEQEKRILWVNGPAGSGKSTIARTFAETCFSDGRLGASFFCSRDIRDGCNLRVIFPTLAFQLAQRYPQFRNPLLRILRAEPNAGKGSLSSQLGNLVVRPLKATKMSTLIIIDALDECEDREPTSTLLSVLSHFVRQIPNVKIFIASRPEPHIQEGFRLESLHSITSAFRLHDVDRSSVDEDIKLYLRTRLTEINGPKGHKIPEGWPNPHEIDILCEKAAGLFIYASKLIEFVKSKDHLPTERLERIVQSQGTTHEAWIDLTYTQTLKLVFQDVDPDGQKFYSHCRTIFGAVSVAFHPLSTKVLFDLVRKYGTPSQIRTILHLLHSLLDVPDSEDDPIRVFHPSFIHFLSDRTRCKDERFFIDTSVHHENILFSCLDLMKGRLKKNICDLDDYAVLGDVRDLPARRKACIGGSLEYACRFWTRHLASLSGDGPHIERVRETIDEFFTNLLLCWIEVLSIMGCLEVAIHAINDIRQWYISVSHTQVCSHIPYPHTSLLGGHYSL